MITQESVDSDFCRKLLIPTVVILLLGFSPPSISQEFLLLTNANVVNPRSQQIEQGHLLIADNKIVKTMSEVPGDFQGATIDLGGKWVIPGLNELHTHSMGNMVPPFTLDAIGTTATARRLLSVGVTSLLDLFNDEDYIYRLRALQREWIIPGADIFASLSCLTATNGHCTEYGLPTRVIDSPEQAKQVVTELARKQPDVIKIVYQQGNRMPTISLATLKEAVKTANSLGLKTVIHIWSISDMEGAIAAGPSSLTHLPVDAEVTPALAQKMAEDNIAIIPTLTALTDLVAFLQDPRVLDAPMAKRMSTERLRRAYTLENLGMSESVLEELQRRSEIVFRSTKILSDAGVLMLTGSDSGNWGTIQGYSVHRELIRLVDAGLSTWQALAASTVNAGKFLGQDYGVNPGDEANLVVLRASPIENIANTQKIELVIHHGKVVEDYQ